MRYAAGSEVFAVDAGDGTVAAREALRRGDADAATRAVVDVRRAGSFGLADAFEVLVRVARGEVPEAWSDAEAAVVAARRRGDAALAAVLAACGAAALAAGEVRTARDRLTEAESRTDPDDEEARAALQADLARLLLLEAEPAAAEERAAAAVAAFDALDDAVGSGLALLLAAEARRARGEVAGARELLGIAADRLAGEAGDPQRLWWLGEAEQALAEGKTKDALRLVRRALGIKLPTSAPLHARSWTTLGDAHAALGATDAARHGWRTATAAYLAGAGDAAVPLTHEALAFLHAGQVPEAAERFVTLLERAERTGRVDRRSALHAGLLACAAAEGDWAAWERHLRRAEALAGRTVVHEAVAAAGAAADRCVQRALAGDDPAALSRAVRTLALALHGWEKLGLSEEALAAARVLSDLGSRGAPIPAGPFDLGAPLGAGAMGAVWRARHHRRPLDVAVKLLPPAQAGDERWHGLLASEIRSVAALDHPNIVRILDTGRLGSASEAVGHGAVRVDSPWFAMGLADGGTLEALCGELDWEGCRAVLLALLDALGHAHARGVIHLDLKPSNVLLRAEPDGRKSVVLSDFGLARVWAHTHQGAWVAGTPPYMAPEQFVRDSREIGPRTDLYGLGCLAWHLVTGEGPFVGDSGEDFEEQHRTVPPPPLRSRVRVPRALETWLKRLLEKTPADRFANAADAAWHLRKLRADDETRTEVRARTVPPHWDVRRAHDIPTWSPDTALATAGLRRPPVVGRAAERDALWAGLRRVSESRRGETVVLAGDPGMGKSALARWFTERVLETGVAEVLDAGTASDGQQGLDALVRRSLRLDGLGADDATARIRTRFPDMPEALATDLGILAAEHGVAVASDERVAAVAALVEQIAHDARVVVRLSPRGSADRDQVALAGWLDGLEAPVFVVVEGDLPPGTIEGATRLALGPMPETDMEAVLDVRVPLEGPLRARIVALARGNPEAAVRCVNDLVSRDLLVPTDSGCVLRTPVTLPGEHAVTP